MVQALEDIQKAGCNALAVYLGNFGPEIAETLLAKHFDGPKDVPGSSRGDGQQFAGWPRRCLLRNAQCQL